MIAVKAHYDGYSFIPENPVVAEINQEAVITLLDGENSKTSKKQQLLSLAGSITHDDYLEIEKVLEDTERVYQNEW